jgi:hypothetical protein
MHIPPTCSAGFFPISPQRTQGFDRETLVQQETKRFAEQVGGIPNTKSVVWGKLLFPLI